MSHQTQQRAVDALTLLKDAGLVALDSAGTVGGVARVIDLGNATAFSRFDVVIDWTALELDDADEIYRVEVQGSTSSSFSTYHVLAERRLGALSGKGPAQDTPEKGRVILRGDNLAFVANAGTAQQPMRYLRIFCAVEGTVSTGINYSAFLAA